MKRLNKSWLVAGLTVGLSCLHVTPLVAQTNDQSVSAITNAASTNAAVVSTTSTTVESRTSASTKRRGPVVSIGGSASTEAGESAEVVVAIGGSARAGGKVQNAVVAIGGDAEADGDVGDAVVAVGGNATARGRVRDAVVAVAGNAEVDGEVGDAVVAVMGNVRINPGAIVRGDVVSIGGKVDIAESAQVNGQIVEVSVARYPFLAPLQGVADWLRQCVLKFRLLAPQPGWYWIFVLVLLALYFLIAVAIPRPVAACVAELQQRPATTFLLGLLTKLLVPLLVLVLALTGIGVVVIPFLMAAIFIGALIGKVALFEWLGGKTLSAFGMKLSPPALALIVGFLLITLFYMVPFLSLLIYALVGLWALGVVVTTVFSSARKEAPPRPSSAPAGSAPTGGLPLGASDLAAEAEASQSAGAVSSETNVPPRSGAMRIPEAINLTRAGFWERMGAAFLDIIIVALLSALVGGLPFGLLVALAYFAGLWTWKGTTIGGIVLNLKVVRLDDRPVTFAVALVRGLASSLSVIVFFLGFLWMLFDRDKQTWHDKIAGTVVVRSPRAMPLVCI